MASIATGDGVWQRKPFAPPLAPRATAVWAGAGSFLASFCCLAAFWYKQVRLFYFPSGDEFSLFVHSAKPFHPAISAWFLHGFEGYFVPYPQWSSSQTNFLRPVVNAEYYLASLFFGSHWSWYLLSNCIIQSSVVGAAVYLSVRHLKLRPFSIVLIGLICFSSPAFDSLAFFSTAFPFDLLAAVFVFTGLSLLLSGRLVFAWICFTIGIFTKETALFAPAAAALAILWTNPRRGWRRWIVPGCFLVPYLCWEALRRVAFHGVTGIYVFGSAGLDLLNRAENLLRWPFPFDPPLDGTFLLGLIPLSFPIDLFMVLNLCVWVFVAALVFRFVRSCIPSGDRPPGSAAVLLQQIGFVSSTEQVLCLFCAGSSALLLLISHLQPRFGADFLPLFALMLAVVFERSSRRSLRAAALCFLVVPLLVNAVQRAEQMPQAIGSAHLQWAMAADYIHKISHSSSPMIFTVDDLTGDFSSTASIQAFAGYSGQLVRIDDLVWEGNCPVQPQITITGGPSAVSIVSTVDSPCAGHDFLGADVSPIGGQPRTREVGPAQIVYQGMPPLSRHSIVAPGQLSVSIERSPQKAVILLPDLRLRAYREEPLDRAEGPR